MSSRSETSTVQAVDAEGLTSEWLSAALGRSVRLRSSERIGTGQIAAAYRLVLEGEGLPQTLVAKVNNGDEAARQRVWDGCRAEVGFYADVAHTVAIRVPKCWYVAAADEELLFTLLLEDLAPRTPGVQADGCTLQQAEDAICNLAGLHAPRWNDESVFQHSYLRRHDAAGAEFMGQVTVSATQEFVARYRDDLTSADAKTLQEAADGIAAWALTRPEPFSLLHGDYRLDNLMFAPAGSDVVAVDWQTLSVGPPLRDVAYFLGTSLDTDLRRSGEQRLVSRYHEELLARGVQDYSADRCFEDYRLGQLHGPLITTLGAIYATAERTERADGMFLAMARRSCAAIRDLRSLELI
jgi:fructosamine-3-kinase